MWQKRSRNKPKPGGRGRNLMLQNPENSKTAPWVWPMILAFLLPEITDLLLHCYCPVFPPAPIFLACSAHFSFAFHAINPAQSVTSPCCRSHISCLCPTLTWGSFPAAINLKKKPFPLEIPPAAEAEGLEITSLPALVPCLPQLQVLPPAALTPSRIHEPGWEGNSPFCKDE